MRTNEYIDASFGQFLQNTASFFGCPRTAQVFHLARHSLQTLLKRLIMLESQHRGRHQYRYLLVVGHCLESSPDGHFRLTEAYVPTHQTVHRLVALHVRLHFLCRLQLVGCILVQEAGFQFMLQEAVGTVFKSFFLFTLRIQLNQIAGNVLNLGLRPFLDFLPCTGSQFADTRLFAFLSFVLRDFMQRMNGHKHHVVILIHQFYDLLRSIPVRNAHQSRKTADTVVDMHHIIPRLKRVQFLQ